MKIITASLSGAALDWAVAKCEGTTYPKVCLGGWVPYVPSTDWSQGGPIIFREEIAIHPSNTTPHEWVANAHARIFIHKHPLVAAMRCFAASKLGDEVEVPEELL